MTIIFDSAVKRAMLSLVSLVSQGVMVSNPTEDDHLQA